MVQKPVSETKLYDICIDIYIYRNMHGNGMPPEKL